MKMWHVFALPRYLLQRPSLEKHHYDHGVDAWNLYLFIYLFICLITGIGLLGREMRECL